MTIHHHPSEPLVLAYAAGTLDPGEHIAIATHLAGCRECRQFAQAMESAGGALLADMAEADMAFGALDRIAARLDEPVAQPAAPAPLNESLKEFAGLPDFVRRLPAAPWHWVAPGLHLRRLKPPAASPTRVFLLRARAGMRMLPHGHDGIELTCVLSGSFSHDGNRYGPGDFDCGEADNDHTIAIGEESECICLVGMRGKLQLRGLAGRILQPLIAI